MPAGHTTYPCHVFVKPAAGYSCFLYRYKDNPKAWERQEVGEIYKAIRHKCTKKGPIRKAPSKTVFLRGLRIFRRFFAGTISFVWVSEFVVKNTPAIKNKRLRKLYPGSLFYALKKAGIRAYKAADAKNSACSFALYFNKGKSSP